MKVKMKYFAAVLVVIIVTLSLYFLSGSLTGQAVGSELGLYDRFGQCLTEKGATMYGAAWCGHCQEQKKMFGDSFNYVNYVECPENAQLCSSEGVRAYPTWKIGGRLYEGSKPLASLSSLSGCPLS